MNIRSKSLILLVFISVSLGMLLPSAWAKAPFAPAHGLHAMVASVHPEATRVGLQIMRQGGNAVDAAVAVGFALAVVHPQAGNLGGGGFMLVRDADGATHFLDFREKAPAAATRNMYLDAQGNVIPDLSLVGYKAAGVPGSVAGLVAAEKNWGKLGLRAVMAPAILLARHGFRLSYEDAQDLQSKHLADFPESRRIFQRNGRFYAAGDIFRQPELARTLERIAADPNTFYRGDMARQIAAAVQKGGGLISAKDLAEYATKEREPIRGTYRGYEIISAPLPSSGGIALVEILNILEGYDLGRLGNRSAESIHLTVEAFRRAMYDRADFLGDPDFTKIPVAPFLSKDYAALWRKGIDPARAAASRELERPSFPGLPAVEKTPPHAPEPMHTTHYSVVDPQGNAVAVTTTLNESFGSKVTLPGLGFLLNDEMDDFTSKPGAPNTYGLIQGPANAIGPGKRPLSAMSPTMVAKDGKLFLVLGSPGGPRIITTVANIIMGVIDYGLNIQQAVNAPRFHHQWLPDKIYLEKTGFSPDTVRLLEQRGHRIEQKGYWSDGECIEIDAKTGERLGATDARGNGSAMGY